MLRCTLSGRRCERVPPSPPAPSVLSTRFAVGAPCAQHRMNDVRQHDARCFESWIQSIMCSPEVSRRPAVLQRRPRGVGEGGDEKVVWRNLHPRMGTALCIALCQHV